jgi:hypothetical protein
MALNLTDMLVSEFYEFTKKGNRLKCKLCSSHGGEILDYDILDCGAI